MVEKLTGKMDVLVAIGFGFFLAWRQNLINFLYPMSAGLVFSPLVCMSFACCLVLVLALVAFRSNQASFSSRVLVSMPAVLIVAATLCAYLVAKDFGGAVLAYAAALIIGVASALGLFSWVEMLAVVDVGTRIVTAVFALLIKALAEKGLGDDAACAQTVSKLLALDAEGQPFTFFRTLGIL